MNYVGRFDFREPLDRFGRDGGDRVIEPGLLAPLFLVSAAVWFGFLLLYTIVWLVEGGWPPDLFVRLLTSIASTGLTFLAGVLVFVVLEKAAFMRWAAVLGLAAATLILHALIGSFIVVATASPELLGQLSFYQVFLTAMIYSSPIVSSAFIGFVAIHYGHRLNRQQRLSLEATNAAREAQLAVLRHQLNPHFLFNTLNSISALVSEGDAEDAERTIHLLSDFLRFSLESDPVALVPLEEELANVDKYLKIEQVRYADRLRVVTTVSEASANWPVPPFLLQPLLENVIKHAVARVKRQVTVQIECRVDNDALSIRVEDDGPGVSGPMERSGAVGLSNLKARLNLIYGSGARLTVRPGAPHGACVRVSISDRAVANA